MLTNDVPGDKMPVFLFFSAHQQNGVEQGVLHLAIFFPVFLALKITFHPYAHQ